MFGQQNNTDQDDQKIPEHSIDGVINDTAAPADATVVTPAAPSTDDQAQWQHPGTPIGEDGKPVEVAAPVADKTPAVLATAPTTNELIDIKQKALQQLTPLVGHLDQAPEEKFRTTMMMIQASDDQTLVSIAYEAANAIEDEKTKAQALLDIVNEINYFTSQHPAAPAA